MKTEEKPASAFPLPGGPAGRVANRAPRRSDAGLTAGPVMGNRAFLRAWAARRGARVKPPAGRDSRLDNGSAV